MAFKWQNCCLSEVNHSGNFCAESTRRLLPLFLENSVGRRHLCQFICSLYHHFDHCAVSTWCLCEKCLGREGASAKRTESSNLLCRWLKLFTANFACFLQIVRLSCCKCVSVHFSLNKTLSPICYPRPPHRLMARARIAFTPSWSYVAILTPVVNATSQWRCFAKIFLSLYCLTMKCGLPRLLVHHFARNDTTDGLVPCIRILIQCH